MIDENPLNPLNQHLNNKRNVENLTKANLNLQKIHKTEIQGNINRP